MLVLIYERMVAIAEALDPKKPTRVWDSIQWIRNMWVDGSAGFKCKYFDRKAQPALFDSLLPRICRDAGMGSCDHPGCDTWREFPLPGDDKGLHFLVGNNFNTVLHPNDTARLDEVHLDWTSPVSSIEGGQCSVLRAFDWDSFNPTSYAPVCKHVTQAIFGIGNPVSPFKFEDYATEVETLDNATHKLTQAERGRLADLRASWNENGRTWACQGQTGWDAAMPYLRQVQEYHAKVR